MTEEEKNTTSQAGRQEGNDKDTNGVDESWKTFFHDLLMEQQETA